MSELIIHDYVDFSVSWPTIDELRVSGRDYRLYSLLEYVPFSKWWSRFKQQLTLTASSHYTCAIYLPNVFLPHAYVTWRQLILDIPFRPFGLNAAKHFKLFGFPIFDFERPWWRLFQKCVSFHTCLYFCVLFLSCHRAFHKMKIKKGSTNYYLDYVMLTVHLCVMVMGI